MYHLLPPYNLPFYTSYALCDSTLRLDYTTGLYDWTKRLDSQELKGKGIMVSILHPGFNKTEMTKKYEHIWEIEGAVDPSVGAKRVMHEISLMSLDNTGTFINCEDGLPIPW